MSATGQSITYLRRGRQKRNTGSVLVAKDSMGNVKVKPSQAAWKSVWLSPEEVSAGSGKPIRREATQKVKPPTPISDTERLDWLLQNLRGQFEIIENVAGNHDSYFIDATREPIDREINATSPSVGATTPEL